MVGMVCGFSGRRMRVLPRPRLLRAGKCSVLYAFAATLVLSATQVFAAGDTDKAIQAAATKYFSTKSDYRPGDVIRRSDLTGIIKLLDETGVPAKRFAALEDYIPADSSEIQRLNAGKKGKQFLRNLAGTPGGYAGVEDLASRPGGARDVRQLANSPGGDVMITYMTTTSGGRKMMQMTPKGKKTGKQEPRIYTESQLVQAMMQLSRIDAAPTAK